MLTCKEASRLISQGLDRKLPILQRASLQAHLLICRGCMAMSDRMAFLRRAMKRLADRDGPGTS